MHGHPSDAVVKGDFKHIPWYLFDPQKRKPHSLLSSLHNHKGLMYVYTLSYISQEQ